MSSVSLGVLLSASVTENRAGNRILVNKREGPFDLVDDSLLFLKHWPVYND